MHEARADPPRIRVLIVDDHEISRAAYRALLHTEGLDVVADVPATEQAVAVADALCPQIAIVDISPDRALPLEIARRLRALPRTPTVLLTSSFARCRFEAELDGFQFVAKADICVEEINHVIRHGLVRRPW